MSSYSADLSSQFSTKVELDIDFIVGQRARENKDNDHSVGKVGSYENQTVANVDRKKDDSIGPDDQKDTINVSSMYENQELTERNSPPKKYENQELTEHHSTVKKYENQELTEHPSTLKKYENQELSASDEAGKPGTSYTVPLSPTEVFTVPQHAVPGPFNYCGVDIAVSSGDINVVDDEEGIVPIRVFPDSRGYCDVNVKCEDDEGNNQDEMSDNDPTKKNVYSQYSVITSDLTDTDSNQPANSGEVNGVKTDNQTVMYKLGMQDCKGYSEVTRCEPILDSPTGQMEAENSCHDNVPETTPSGNAIVPNHPSFESSSGYTEIEVRENLSVRPSNRHRTQSSGSQKISNDLVKSMEIPGYSEVFTPPPQKPKRTKRRNNQDVSRRRVPPPPPIKVSVDDNMSPSKKPTPFEGVVNSGLCTLPRSKPNSGVSKSLKPPPPPVPFAKKKSDEMQGKPPQSAVRLPILPLSPQVKPQSPEESANVNSPGLKKKFFGLLKMPVMGGAELRRSIKRKKKTKEEGKEDLTQGSSFSHSSTVNMTKNLHVKQQSFDDEYDESGMYSVIPEGVSRSVIPEGVSRGMVESIDTDVSLLSLLHYYSYSSGM